MSGQAFQRDKVKAIVFDMDGTLYQNARMGEQVNLSACHYIASLKGVSVEEADIMLEEARANLVGGGGTLSLSVEALGGNLKDLHASFSRHVNPVGVLEPDARVVDMLKRLAKDFELHLYTNNNRELSGRIMECLGITGLFIKIFTIENYWRPKPDEGALLGILETIGRKPEETLFVGDRYQVDLALPASLGCPVFEACSIEQLLRLSELLQVQ